MKKIIVIISYLLCSYISFAYVNIYPTYFDKRIDTIGATEEFVLTNDTNKEVKYRTYIKKGIHSNTMDEWIEIYPKSVTIKPKSSSKIKLYIKSPANKALGEYYATIVFKELESVKNLKKNNENLKIMTELELEIRGYIGDLNPKLKLSELKVENSILSGKIKNIGTRRGRLEFFLFDKEKDEYLYLGKYNLEKNEEHIFNFKGNNFKKFKKFLIKEKSENVLIKEI